MAISSSVPIQFCIYFRGSTLWTCQLGVVQGPRHFLAKQNFVVGNEIDIIYYSYLSWISFHYLLYFSQFNLAFKLYWWWTEHGFKSTQTSPLHESKLLLCFGLSASHGTLRSHGSVQEPIFDLPHLNFKECCCFPIIEGKKNPQTNITAKPTMNYHLKVLCIIARLLFLLKSIIHKNLDKFAGLWTL